MKIHTLAIVALLPLLIGCQALSALISVTGGSVACASSKSGETFLPDGSKKYINISFDINEGNRTVPFKEVVMCEYQGAICGGGTWFHIWYGDRTLQNKIIELQNGDTLSFDEHAQCLKMDDFLNKCKKSACVPADEFGILVLYSEENTKLRKSLIEKGEIVESKHVAFPDRNFLKFSQLGKTGIKVENLHVTLSDTNL